jgi:eukaryotic-like serine/threonine-protein kinase
MDEKLRCQSCGVVLTSQAVGELCANCLLGLALQPLGEFAVTAEAPNAACGNRIRYFGDYELIEEIARGGMGVVFKARQVSLNRAVALKMILAGDFSSPVMVERFRTEAEAAARLEHPNIVHIYEIGEHAGQHYFSMRFVEGGPLTRLLAQRTFDPRRAAGLMVKVARAVHHAHQHGIIHRDLKPGNILLDSSGEPYVADFGLAKLLARDSALTQSASVLGTPSYMAPEQANGEVKQATTAVDIYSLGAILYELLTGQPPFVARSPLEVLVQVRERDPASPQSLNPDVAHDLSVIALKCLEKDPPRRYASAEAFAEDLQRWLAHEPIQARRTTPPERLWKWARRKPVVAGLLVVILLVFLTGIAGVLRQTRRANVEANNARAETKRAEASELAVRKIAYASDMNLAKHALAAGNFGRAQELLDRYRPQNKVDEDLRGWEWRYFWNQCQSDAAYTLCQRKSAIVSLTVSFDGQWVAVGEMGTNPFSFTNPLSVWDLKSRREIAQLPGVHPNHVQFSPRESLLAFAAVSTNKEGRVWLWDPATRQNVGELPLDGSCRGLVFSSDGQTLMTFTDTTLDLWQVSERRKLKKERGFGGRSLAVSPDLKMSAYVAAHDTIKVVDLPAGTERWTAQGADDWSATLRFSTDGRILASGSGRGGSDIRLWEAASGKELGRLNGHSSWITALSFGSDNRIVASASGDQTVRVWDLETMQPFKVLRGHKREIRSLALVPNSKMLVSGSADGSVYVWDAQGIERKRDGITLATSFENWRFASDSKSILVVGEGPRILRSKGSDFQEWETWLDNSAIWQSSLRSILISPDGRSLAVSFTNDHVQVWNLEQRQLFCEFKADPCSDAFAFVADGKKLVTVSMREDSFHEWDLNTRNKTRSWPVAQPQSMNAFPATGGWGLDTGGWISRIGYTALCPNGKFNLTLSYKGAAVIQEVGTGRQTEAELNISAITGIAFSPDSKFLAVASDVGFARLWEAGTLRQVATFGGFLLNARSVAFSPDGKRLAIGSSGKEAIKLWDAESHQELFSLEGEGAEFNSSAFSPDGNVLGTMNTKGVIHLWRAPSWEEIEASEQFKAVP